MTYNTKNTTIVIAFAAILLAMPFATQNAQAVDLVIEGSCGITVVGGSGGIDLGSLAPNAESIEFDVIVTTDGTQVGTFEIEAADWISSGTTSTGYITIGASQVDDTSSVTINGEAFLATAATQDANNFISGDAATSATNLATAINANGSVDVTAVDTEDIVLLRSDTAGTAAEYSMSSADGNMVVGAATLAGATNSGAVIMQAELTKYDVTNTGTVPISSTYASKTALLAAGVNDIIVPLIDVTEDVDLQFQVLGTLDDPDFFGTVTQVLTFAAICV